MKPVYFEGWNATYAENQPEYKRLPARVGKDGVVSSCWAPTWRERLRLVFGARLFLHVMTFGQPLQPVLLTLAADPAEQG